MILQWVHENVDTYKAVFDGHEIMLLNTKMAESDTKLIWLGLVRKIGAENKKFRVTNLKRDTLEQAQHACEKIAEQALKNKQAETPVAQQRPKTPLKVTVKANVSNRLKNARPGGIVRKTPLKPDLAPLTPNRGLNK